ncbi:MAG: hypothetical protein H6Q57_1401 [Geobacteraceae bacterium]|jgi:hypothetical protein|nr:hypothetical protein [Geobacteraceae bacterium]
MKYEFSDGMVVDYSGSIHVTRGTEIDLFIEEGYIPVNVRKDLEEATRKGSRDDIKKIAVMLTDTVGSKACLADIDSKACVNL